MAGGVAMLVAASAASAARHRQEADVRTAGEVWAAFAGQRGLSKPGTTASALPFLDGTLDGVRWRLRVVRDEHGWAHTQAFADAMSPARCEIGVYTSPAGFLDWVKSHFEEDVEIGDPPFDRAFVIRAHPQAMAKSLLSEDVRHLMTQFLGHALDGLTYKEGVVALQWRGVERDMAVLEHAIGLVVMVAQWNP